MIAACAPNRYQRRPACSNARASAARMSANGEGTRCLVQEALQGDVVREILGAIAFGREVRPDAAHVLVQGMARVQSRAVRPLAILRRPVRALLALDLDPRSQREGA